jgi:RimJ/RimL family protein N-acetyltransferase
MENSPLPRSVTLKDGREILLRRATGDDAREILLRIDRIAAESRNMSMQPGEFPMTLSEERDYLNNLLRSENRIFFVAVDQNRIVGECSFHGGPYQRIRHQGLLGMSVDRSHWGLGIGRALLQALIDWARATGIIRKLNLRVMVYNRRAIALYRKMGFVEEGRHSRTFLIDGDFNDDISMGLEIDPEPRE